LFLSQCCGPDLYTQAGSELKAFARPVFNTLDCPAGHYYSHIVAKNINVGSNPVIAVNADTSFSGCTALLKWLERTGRAPQQCKISGSHQNSLFQLLSGAADVAAIDAYSWQFIDHDELKIIDRSETAPAPPFVCHSECIVSPKAIYDALRAAFKDQGEPLQLTELMPADNRLYQSV